MTHDQTYSPSRYAAWAEFNRQAQEVGTFALAAGEPAIVTNDGLTALNLGRVVVVTQKLHPGKLGMTGHD